MRDEARLETCFKVIDSKGYFLTVCPYPDAPHVPCITTEGENNKTYFGEICLSLDTDMARKLGVALMRIADIMEETE